MLLSYSEGQCEMNKHSSLEPGCKVRAHFGSLNINYLKDYGGEWEILIGPLITCKLERVYVWEGPGWYTTNSQTIHAQF